MWRRFEWTGMWQIVLDGGVLKLAMVRLGAQTDRWPLQITVHRQTRTICPCLKDMNIHRQEMSMSLTNKENGALGTLDLTNNMTFQWIFISNYHKSLHLERSAKGRCSQDSVIQQKFCRGHVINMNRWLNLFIWNHFHALHFTVSFAAYDRWDYTL